MGDDRDDVWPMPDNNWGCFLGGIGFSLVVALAGAGILYQGYIAQYLAIKDSHNWVETPCEVLKSKVTEGYHRAAGTGPGSYDYALEIRYCYEFGGQEYVSHRYCVATAGDTKEGWRREVVRALPRGSKTVCYVNPESPGEAAISKEFHANKRTVIFPVVLLLLGLLGIVFVILASVLDKNARMDSTERTG